MADSERAYPQTGSNAEKVLDQIRRTPGLTINGLIRATDINPGPIRQILKTLELKGLIRDEPDQREYHHYFAQEVSVR